MIFSLTFPSLPRFLSFKPLPEPLSRFVRPLFFISVGLHIAFLLAPIPAPPTKPKPAQPKTVKLAAMPPIHSSSNQKTLKSLSKIKPSAKPLFKPIAKAHKGLIIHHPSKKVLASTTKLKAEAPKKELRQTTSQNPPAPPVVESNVDPSNPMNGFPHYPGALPGCLGVQACYETGQPLDTVVQHFTKQLPQQKFGIEPTINEPDRKVYQVSKGGTSQFLSILFDGKNAVYTLQEKPIKLSDLQQGVQIPADFSETILAQLPIPASADAGAESADVLPEFFADPSAFYTKLGGTDKDGSEMTPETNAEIDSARLVKGQPPQQLFDSYFTSAFAQLSYQSTPVASGYGGGLLFELKKGTFKPFYLNLIPAKDGQGTAVVVWRSKPS